VTLSDLEGHFSHMKPLQMPCTSENVPHVGHDVFTDEQEVECG